MNRTDLLRLRREQADKYATERGLDMWGTRVAWLIFSEGVRKSRSLCSKYNKNSPAWLAYQNLVDSGLVIEGPEGGVLYPKNPAWDNEAGALEYFEAVATVAAGGPKHPYFVEGVL